MNKHSKIQPDSRPTSALRSPEEIEASAAQATEVLRKAMEKAYDASVARGDAAVWKKAKAAVERRHAAEQAQQQSGEKKE